MNIQFADQKFAKEVNDAKLLRRRHGDRRARLIRRRLDELFAAQTLAELRLLPGPRCHELRGDRTGQLSVDLDHPYRLIFTLLEPRATKPDGGMDWAQTTAVVVLGVEDTHE